MDFDELSPAVETLQQDRDRLREDCDRLRREFDQLNSKLRYPGTKFLVDLEYALVRDKTVTIPAQTRLLGSVFDTLPGLLHAVYVLSAYAVNSATAVVLVDGTLPTLAALVVPPPNALGIAIQRQQQSNPTRIEMRLVFQNTGPLAVDVAVRVWRRLGMGSSTA